MARYLRTHAPKCVFALLLCMVVAVTVAQDPQPDLDNYEWSMANEYHFEESLIPQVRLQVGGTCVFHALAYDAETQLRRDRWSRKRKSDVIFDGHSFSTDYIREMMVRVGYDQVNRVATALQMFRDKGVFALSQSWDGRHRFPISGYQQHTFHNHEDVFNIIRNGYPVLGILRVRDDFRLLQDGIYELQPPESPENPIGGTHMVMFMGVGMQQGRPYLLFLNSYGAGFGTNGIGRVFFDQVVHSHFYTLLVDENGAMAAAAGSLDGPGGPPPSGSSGRQPPAGGAAGGSAPRGGGDNCSKRRRLSNTPSASSGTKSVQSHLMGLAIPTAQFVGTVRSRSGFLDVNVDENISCQSLNQKKCGITSITPHQDPTPVEAVIKSKKKHWGPIQARQSSRVAQDGKKILDKVVERAQQRNLEKPPPYKACSAVHLCCCFLLRVPGPPILMPSSRLCLRVLSIYVQVYPEPDAHNMLKAFLELKCVDEKLDHFRVKAIERLRNVGIYPYNDSDGDGVNPSDLEELLHLFRTASLSSRRA